MFCHFLKVASLVFLDIAQDCCLGLVELKPPKKVFCGPYWRRNDLFYSNVVERLLKFACYEHSVANMVVIFQSKYCLTYYLVRS